MTSATRWGGLAVIAGGLLFVARAGAQERDLSKETAERLRVEAQRLEIVYSEAIRNADQIGKTNPARAVEILLAAKGQIDADTDALKAERRADLSRWLRNAIKSFDEKAVNSVITPGPTGRPGTGTGHVRSDPAADEARRAKEEAERRIKGTKDVLVAQAEIRRQAAEGFNQTNLAVLRLMIPEYRDISFPADWPEKSKRRTKGIQLTEKEKVIVKALNTLMTIEVEGKTFREVLDYLKDKTGMSFIVDQRALDELNITYKSPVNLNLRNVTTRTVLKKMLADLGLVYVMKDEAIQITTPARAKEMLSVRMYSVADLMPAVDMRFGPIVTQLQMYQTLQQLVLLIVGTVEPDSWEVNGKGGLGTISFYAPTMSLVVKQTAEMHYLLGLSAVGR
jgi:hypothetical protein